MKKEIFKNFCTESSSEYHSFVSFGTDMTLSVALLSVVAAVRRMFFNLWRRAPGGQILFLRDGFGILLLCRATICCVVIFVCRPPSPSSPALVFLAITPAELRLTTCCTVVQMAPCTSCGETRVPDVFSFYQL